MIKERDAAIEQNEELTAPIQDLEHRCGLLYEENRELKWEIERRNAIDRGEPDYYNQPDPRFDSPVRSPVKNTSAEQNAPIAGEGNKSQEHAKSNTAQKLSFDGEHRGSRPANPVCTKARENTEKSTSVTSNEYPFLKGLESLVDSKKGSKNEPSPAKAQVHEQTVEAGPQPQMQYRSWTPEPAPLTQGTLGEETTDYRIRLSKGLALFDREAIREGKVIHTPVPIDNRPIFPSPVKVAGPAVVGQVAEPTVTAASVASNVSRKRHHTPQPEQRPNTPHPEENMTSAFILPDINIVPPETGAEIAPEPRAETAPETRAETAPETRAEAAPVPAEEVDHTSRRHQKTNCVVCQRISALGDGPSADRRTVLVSRPVPVSERVPHLKECEYPEPERGVREPFVVIAIAIKAAEDELVHSKCELRRVQKAYTALDPSISKFQRLQYSERIQKLLWQCDQQADHIYSLYDLLDCLKKKGMDMTREQVEVTVVTLEETARSRRGVA